MDKGYGNESNNSSNNNRDMYLKQINKNSHKISKQSATNRNKPLLPPPPPAMPTALSVPPPIIDPPNPQPQSQQPPVYNINKNDFRDVVQKLTGSPAHDHRSPPPPPPPITHSRPPSSRLQRIRPPPLSQIASQRAASPPPQSFAPLPPLPAVHPAAESPISAYMRFLQNPGGGFSPAPPPPMDSPVSAYMRFLQNSANTSSPRWNAAPPAPQHPFPAPPLSPLPFGCVPSPRSGFGMLSPSFLLSPTGGQLGLPQLPLSPTLPILSPRWKGM